MQIAVYYEYPFILGYLALVAAILWVGWRITSRIGSYPRRVLCRSGVLAIALAPGFFGAGHGGGITPALRSAYLVFATVDLSSSGVTLLEFLLVLFFFAIAPILVTWFLVFVVWRYAPILRRSADGDRTRRS
jgi:hypothetical protein